MKNKGFTLIELLAVIVILAIIALIATPIIINIINDSRESSNKRSIELYGKAVENAIAKAQLNKEVFPNGKYSLNSATGEVCHSEQTTKCITPEVNGTKPYAYSMKIENGEITEQTIQLKQDAQAYKKVGNRSWTYGTEQPESSTLGFKPQYYGDWGFYGEVGITDAPESPLTVPPTGKSLYLGYDVVDGKVSVGYVCFVRNDKEYCLKGNDLEEYKTNQDIIREAYAEVADTDACSIVDGFFGCYADGLGAAADPDGNVFAQDDIAICNSTNIADFECSEL